MFEEMISIEFIWRAVIYPVGAIFIVFLIGFLARRVIFSVLRKWADRTHTQADNVFIEEMSRPFILWVLLLGFSLAARIAPLDREWLDIVNKAVGAVLILSLTMVLARIAIGLLRLPSTRIRRYLPSSTLTQSLVRISIYTFGFLIALNTLGISITPLLTAFGLGGLAVALALQDTLSNLFSGFYISLSRQVRVGDFIKLESGEEGYVTDIGWRATRVRMLPNNTVLLPNSKLAQSVITNYYYPERDLGVLVDVGVHYESDLEEVERVTLDVGREVMKEVKGGIPGYEPFMRFHTFDNFSINFTIILRAKEFLDSYRVKHEFIKRLHRRYAKEGINIPYPINAINFEQERSQAGKKV